ncbi:MAG TPA: PHP domain-containing protein [Bacteroidales bacterium]|nr:PHP domain-containing protein [Bacteroidales bacterium]
MQWYKADLHIHTVLSPCGGPDMSPVNIIRQAAEKKLNIIAITDHNSTLHCRLAQKIGARYGITVIAGAEINTSEEIHCLTFFENTDTADTFQAYIDENLTVIENKQHVFGHQYIVDEDENILGEEERFLGASLKKGIDEVSRFVNEIGGLFIPAHINRRNNGIYNQIGLIPESARIDAVEVAQIDGFRDFLISHPETGKHSRISNSDSHHLERIGVISTEYYLEKPVFAELVKALKNEESRTVKPI